jgi:hypothetical protein
MTMQRPESTGVNRDGGDERVQHDSPTTTMTTQRTAQPEQSDKSATSTSGNQGLLSGGEISGLQSRWDEIQRGFIDDPRAAAARADELLSETIHKISEVIERERTQLSERWNRGDQVSTDDIRIAVQRYRSLFHWLLELQPGFRNASDGHGSQSNGAAS